MAAGALGALTTDNTDTIWNHGQGKGQAMEDQEQSISAISIPIMEQEQSRSAISIPIMEQDEDEDDLILGSSSAGTGPGPEFGPGALQMLSEEIPRGVHSALSLLLSAVNQPSKEFHLLGIPIDIDIDTPIDTKVAKTKTDSTSTTAVAADMGWLYSATHASIQQNAQSGSLCANDLHKTLMDNKELRLLQQISSLDGQSLQQLLLSEVLRSLIVQDTWVSDIVYKTLDSTGVRVEGESRKHVETFLLWKAKLGKMRALSSLSLDSDDNEKDTYRNERDRDRDRDNNVSSAFKHLALQAGSGTKTQTQAAEGGGMSSSVSVSSSSSSSHISHISHMKALSRCIHKAQDSVHGRLTAAILADSITSTSTAIGIGNVGNNNSTAVCLILNHIRAWWTYLDTTVFHRFPSLLSEEESRSLIDSNLSISANSHFSNLFPDCTATHSTRDRDCVAEKNLSRVAHVRTGMG
jgi:hypothetical protein